MSERDPYDEWEPDPRLMRPDDDGQEWPPRDQIKVGIVLIVVALLLCLTCIGLVFLFPLSDF